MNLANPAMLGFLALGLIPIVIYLINRQRYRRRRWAAMEFLLKAMKRHQRRLRLENWLLMLLRTLALLLFVMAMARPTLTTDALPILGKQVRQEAVIIDASGSTAARKTSRTTMEAARDQARQLLLGLKAGDRTSLLVGGLPPSETPIPLLEVVGEMGPAGILGDLEQLSPGWLTLTPEVLISEAANLANERGGNWSFHIYSDFQRGDWLSEDGTELPALREALERLDSTGAELILHPVGPDRPRNVTLVSLRPSSGLISSDVPVAFQAVVENRGIEMVPGIEVEFLVDGQVQGSRRIDVEGGEGRTISFPHIFRLPGVARVEVRLRSDDLDRDDVRYFTAEVLEAVDVLVVDGGWDAISESSESDWLVAALGTDEVGPTGVRLSPYRVEVIPEDRFFSADLDSARVLVLADMSRMSEEISDKIEDFLKRGGGVLIFNGPRMVPESWSTHAWRGGSGWFPYEAGPAIVDKRRQNFFHWQIDSPDHPVLNYLSGFPEAGLGDVAVHGHRKPLSPVSESDVLMTLDDFESTPILVQKGYEGGVLLVFGTGADRDWSNFPITPAYVCFLHEAFPWLILREGGGRNLALGQPWVQQVSSEDYAPRVTMLTPDGGAVPLALKETEDRRSFRLEVPGRWIPGVYEIRFESDNGEVRSDAFAVNARPEEGALVLADPEEIAALYPAVAHDRSQLSDQEKESRGASLGDIWYPLFWTVLALLVTETGLAYFFGRARRRGK
ncbi:MAG: BatA domain-containing protein [Planctomycetota bacterium]|nr:BatA domain-containing protein [Planctomycetota bacterium]